MDIVQQSNGRGGCGGYNAVVVMKKPLEIWGVQSKTEIGGFLMVGPVDPQDIGCTAYVCNGADAKEIIHAVNCHDDLLEALEAIDSEYTHFNHRISDTNINKVKAAIKKAKGL